jgi:hypothetical protein
MTRRSGADRPKVFGIGLRKTGTRSVADAMRELGYRTLHQGGRTSSQLVDRAVDEGQPLLRYLGEQYDAYFDVESLVHLFDRADREYPGSRFLLTTRPVEPWIDSLERHVLANQGRAARGEYEGTLLVVDPERWLQEYESHHAAVRSYFADRPGDLLEIDITRGDGWEVLAPFLGVPAPSTAFPWENREGAGTYRPRGVASTLARRVRFAAAEARGRVTGRTRSRPGR